MLSITLTFGLLAALIAFTTAVHEGGHALAARGCGWKIEGLLLHPLGVGLKVEMGDPRDLWKVSIGGLYATAWLALCFLALAPLGIWFVTGFAVNASLLFANLIPFGPFDGAHIRRSLRWATS